MANDITELRSLLFDTVRGIKDKTISIEQAKAISEVSQVVINSARVEFAKATGAKMGSEFLAVAGRPGVTTHRIGG